jgi:hypothetical protein
MSFRISRLGLMSAAVTGVCALPVPFAGANAETAPAIALTPMQTVEAFLGKKKNKTATDLSGISCMAPNGASRICLALNDENKNAQFATIEGNRITVGQPVTLIGDAPDHERTLGSPPDKLGCSAGPGEFADFDGEGVAFSAPFFYVVGSHGCSRNANEFRLSSFILARIRVDDAGQPAAKDAVQNTYRVSDILQRAGEAAKSFGKDLKIAPGGLNIEGIAVDGDRIWFGLRAPLDKDSNAFLVEASVKDLFAAGHDPSKATPIPPIQIALGGLGIRDLAVLADKRLLILAGAPEGPELPFRIFIFNPADGTKDERGTFPAVTQMVENKQVTGKAEAITVLDMDANNIRAVVLFDGLPEGAAQLAVIPRK